MPRTAWSTSLVGLFLLSEHAWPTRATPLRISCQRFVWSNVRYVRSIFDNYRYIVPGTIFISYPINSIVGYQEVPRVNQHFIYNDVRVITELVSLLLIVGWTISADTLCSMSTSRKNGLMRRTHTRTYQAYACDKYTSYVTPRPGIFNARAVFGSLQNLLCVLFTLNRSFYLSTSVGLLLKDRARTFAAPILVLWRAIP